MTLKKRRPRAGTSAGWYVLYIVLAVLDLAVAGFTLYQHSRVTTLLDAGAQANAALNERQREVAQLDVAAARLDAAVNDVFANHAVANERRNFHVAESDFAAAIVPFRADAIGDAALLSHLDRLQSRMHRIVAGGDALFASLDRGDITSASVLNAQVDSDYREARIILQAIIYSFEEIQNRTFASERVDAARMRSLEIPILWLIATIVVGMAVFGRQLARQVLSAREREQLLDEQQRSSEALRTSEERFRLAACATNDVMWDWDIVTNALWFSESYKTQLGHATWGDLDLTAWANNIHPEDAGRILDSVHATVENGEHFWSGEYRFRRADGFYVDMFDRGYVVFDGDGRPVRMIGAMLDLTNRKKAEAAAEMAAVNVELKQLSQKHKLILNTAADGIFGLDVNGRATFLNRAGAAMIGFSLEELAAGRIHDIIHHTYADGTPFPAVDCPTLVAMLNGESVQVTDDLFWRKDGSSFAAEYSSTPMRDEDGTILGAVVTFRDITERRAVQRLKDEFVSLVSHELRTPLTSIRGALGLLAGGLMTTAPEKAARMLDIAVNNTDRLVRLINDILDLERIDSGKVTLVKSRCRPAVLLQESAELIRPMAERAGVRIEIGAVADANVWADSDRIGQTLTNLLSNAIKFSPYGTTIRLSAELSGDAVVFRVADQGRGIPTQKLETIFERFQQVDASDARQSGGSGLGLTICRSIVAEHGGQLRVESVVGVGSVFSFFLPLAAPHRIEADNGSGAKVIVCDDDADVRGVLQYMLEQHGYHVRQAGSGEELIQLTRAFVPDVILLDLFMPGMSGWDTMGALRGDITTASIPVVILSGLTADESPAPFDAAGWVSKPPDERMLLHALEGALALAGRRPCVMVIEDDFDLARVITASFERHGIESHHAATGQEAIDMGREMTPDLLILDLGLPDLDGYAVVDWLRTQERLRNVALIVYSAADPNAEERERLRLGPTQFLTKSRVLPEEFERRVIQLLDAVTRNKKELAHVA
jgi:PAS domain S-box-containing protein